MHFNLRNLMRHQLLPVDALLRQRVAQVLSRHDAIRVVRVAVSRLVQRASDLQSLVEIRLPAALQAKARHPAELDLCVSTRSHQHLGRVEGGVEARDELAVLAL